MSSSPPPIPKRSPKRNSPKRGPLQERGLSEANSFSSRLVRESTGEGRDDGPPDSTPFPTKPAQIFLPSTLRRQRAGNGAENVFPAILSPSSYSSLKSRSSTAEREHTPQKQRPPVLQLKRSVTALRDMYEAQAEKSRPSTASSPPLRPMSSNPRLRSASSSEALHGRHAWETFQKVSSDDLALLPSLAETMSTIRKIPSNSSFRSRAARLPAPSSPNFVTLGEPSSPRFAIYSDGADPFHSIVPALSSPVEEMSPVQEEQSSSSPNVVQLGRSSSFDDSTNQSSSSPNIVRMGSSSSPSNVTTAQSSSSPPPSPSSETPKKPAKAPAKSSPTQQAMSIAYASSPPYMTSAASEARSSARSLGQSITLPTPPPREEPGGAERRADSPETELDSEDSSGQSIAETHATLQAALESSPAPPIHYPVVRAPPSRSFVGISVQKRPNRSSGDPEPFWRSRLSAIPSEFSGKRSGSRGSSIQEGGDDASETSADFAASQAWLTTNPAAEGSQIRIVPQPDVEVDHPEASDEVSALPTSEHGYHYQYQQRPAAPVRFTSFSSFPATPSVTNSSSSRLNSIRNSIDQRLNSMRSFSNSRHNSMRSSSQRPSSAGSAMTTVQIPTWARRYYSGVYRNSFAQLYGSAVISPSQLTSRPNSAQPSTDMSGSSQRSSWSSHSFKDRVRGMLRPRKRPRLEARQSHIEPGVGPLVSNPVRVRPPPPAAVFSQDYPAPQLSPSEHQQAVDARNEDHQPINRASFHPIDPRSHWAGISPNLAYSARGNSRSPARPASSLVPRRHRASEWSPHLHISSRSRWRRSMWHAPSVDEANERFIAFDLRNAQVICFLLGFVCPPSWFVAAVLPLPRKTSMGDLESVETEKQDPTTRASGDGRMWRSIDTVSPDVHLDLEERAKEQVALMERKRFENARWWRGLNRFMCVVGVVVIVVVVVLAVLGTRGNWR